jgi:hypothetical protein
MPYLSVAHHGKHRHRHGIHSLMAYVNQDGFIHYRNCGQAAAATALRYKHLFYEQGLTGIEQNFPPDCALGLFGTSKTQVCNILSALKCHWHEIEGKKALKHAIQHKHPVLVMLSLPTFLPTGHWMVAYSYDDENIYLSNYRRHKDRMTWETFEEGWDSPISYTIDMDNTGIAIR